MSNFYNTQHDQFDYQNGDKIAFSVRVNQKKLARLVWNAAKNKNGKSINGALIIEAKRITEGPLT